MFFLTVVFILRLFSGSTQSLTYLSRDIAHRQKDEGFMENQRKIRSWTVYECGLRSLRVTLLPLQASVEEIPAGAHCDLQAGGAAVVGQRELQLSGHTDALEEAQICAGTAVAALRG